MNNTFKYSAAELLPHSKPMILIDKIINCDDKQIASEIKINEESLFLNKNQMVPAWVGIEYMAQTVAAFIGYQARKNADQVKIGFLLGTRKFNAHETHFELNQEYRVEAKHLFNDQGLGSFECTIKNIKDSIIYCEAKINAYQPDNIDDYLITLAGAESES